MRIGIVGAGIAGLTAGRLLAKHGHEVIVLEKSRGFGGRLATRYAGQENEAIIDHGTGYLTSKSETFKSFIEELKGKDLLKEWDENVSLFNEDGFYETHPSKEAETMYFAPKGMNTIGRYLSRTIDVRLNQQVSGITVVSTGTLKKRPWVINFLDTSVLELDALILATPAIQALGLMHTAQDETPIRFMNSLIAKVEYESTIAIMAGFGKRDMPNWKGVVCQNETLKWVSNENTKRELSEQILVAHSTHEYAKLNRTTDASIVVKDVLKEVSKFAGAWAQNPEWSQKHFWLFNRCVKSLEMDYLESSDTNAPLALIGDYFNGTNVESSYLSGLALAEHWLNKFPNP
jgi:predicted NAD/FAD-dependent oxidoreductase